MILVNFGVGVVDALDVEGWIFPGVLQIFPPPIFGALFRFRAKTRCTKQLSSLPISTLLGKVLISSTPIDAPQPSPLPSMMMCVYLALI